MQTQYVIGGLGALVILFALLAGYLFLEGGGYLTRTDTKAAEVASVIDAVAKHVVLPEGEEPTLATVTSLEPLAGQPFFKNAKLGDRVLIYTQAQKVILFDPTLDRVVEMAPLSLDQEQ